MEKISWLGLLQTLAIPLELPTVPIYAVWHEFGHAAQ